MSPRDLGELSSGPPGAFCTLVLQMVSAHPSPHEKGLSADTSTCFPPTHTEHGAWHASRLLASVKRIRKLNVHINSKKDILFLLSLRHKQSWKLRGEVFVREAGLGRHRPGPSCYRNYYKQSWREATWHLCNHVILSGVRASYLEIRSVSNHSFLE